jgi:MFS family permease
MHSNVRILYILNLLSGLVFWYPIEKLFMQSIGINAFGISMAAVLWLLIILLFDVPSGVWADKWKRKYILMFAMLSLAVSSTWGGLSHNLVQYIWMNIFVGAFVVLTSGTFQALMYDSLKDSGHERDYDRHQGRSYALFLAGLGISSLAGGYMAQWYGMRTNYFATAGLMLVAALLCLFLHEPASRKRVSDRKLKQHVQYSVRQIVGHKLLMQLALLLTALTVLRGVHNEYSGLLFIGIGFSAIPMGFASAGKWLISALGQVVAPKVGRSALKAVPLFFIFSLAFSLIHSRWTLPFFLAACFFYSFLANQAEAAVQDHIEGEVRATSLSVINFVGNVLLVPTYLLFGLVADQSNVFNSYLVISLVGLVYLAVWVLHGRKVLRTLYAQN